MRRYLIICQKFLTDVLTCYLALYYEFLPNLSRKNTYNKCLLNNEFSVLCLMISKLYNYFEVLKVRIIKRGLRYPKSIIDNIVFDS